MRVIYLTIRQAITWDGYDVLNVGNTMVIIPDRYYGGAAGGKDLRDEKVRCDRGAAGGAKNNSWLVG